MYCLSPPMSEPPEGMCYVFKIDVFKNEIKKGIIFLISIFVFVKVHKII